jgi:hypothetical protein
MGFRPKPSPHITNTNQDTRHCEEITAITKAIGEDSLFAPTPEAE